MALLPIVTNIAIGLNQPKPANRTAFVTLDISKAFDTVDHVLLLEKISKTALNPNVTRWLAAYLRGRTAVCLFQRATSKVFKCHAGVPQGSVLSPHLFNFFCHDFPDHTKVNGSYADDFHLSESSPDPSVLGEVLTGYLKHVSEWAEKNHLGIEPAKSHVTFFTPDTKETNFHLDVRINGTLIPLKKKVKFLGNTLTTMYKPTSQIDIIKGKMKKGHQLIKALKGENWGNKETLRQTYQAYVKPTFISGAPAWYPNVNPRTSSIGRLQRFQNAIMHMITGAHQMASQKHLLAETGILSVSEQLDLS
jgi:hypothetical protein